MSIDSVVNSHFRASSVFPAEATSAPQVETESAERTNLEKSFSHLAFPEDELNIAKISYFDVYLSPNEGHPQKIAFLLEGVETGFLVSTGTERSFFNLLFSDQKKCRGLIVRDINPKVKQYVDFSVLLLKISETSSDYRFLSIIESIDYDLMPKMQGNRVEMFKNFCKYQQEFWNIQPEAAKEERDKKIDLIRQKIEEKIHNPIEKRYYLKNLESFAKVYYQTDGRWKKSNLSQSQIQQQFAEVQYDQDEILFQTLRKYAVDGNILATVGNINDLTNFNELPISIVDVSNIPDYVPIDIQFSQNPPIIQTKREWGITYYYKIQPIALSQDERIIYDGLLGKILDAGLMERLTAMGGSFGRLLNSSDILPGPNKQCLEKLQTSVEPSLFNIPNVGWMHLPKSSSQLSDISCKKINQYENSPEILVHICQFLDTHSEHVSTFAYSWDTLSPSVYAALFLNSQAFKNCFQVMYDMYKDSLSFKDHFQRNEQLHPLLEWAEKR